MCPVKSWHVAVYYQKIKFLVILGLARLPKSLLKLQNKPQTHRAQDLDLNKTSVHKALRGRNSQSLLEIGGQVQKLSKH